MAEFEWTGEADGSSWNRSRNWDPIDVPRDGDSIIVRGPHRFIGGPADAPSLTLENVTIGPSARIGGEQISVSDNMNWAGGSLDLSVNILKSATLTIPQNPADEQEFPKRSLAEGTNLTIEGIARFEGGTISMSGDAEITNKGTFEFHNNSNLSWSSGVPVRFINEGDLKLRSNIEPISQFYVRFDGVGLHNFGQIQLGYGGFLELSGGTGGEHIIQADSRLKGQGKLVINGILLTKKRLRVGQETTLELNPGGLITRPSSLSKDQTRLVVLGDFHWYGGRINSSILIQSSGSLRANNSTKHFLTAASLVNEGEIEISGEEIEMSDSEIINKGSMVFLGENLVRHSSGPPPSINNHGTIRIGSTDQHALPGKPTVIFQSLRYRNKGKTSIEENYVFEIDPQGLSQDGGIIDLRGGTLRSLTGLTFELSSGVIQGFGTIDGRVINEANIKIFSDYPWTLEITKDYMQSGSGTLEVNLQSGTIQGLTVRGNAILDNNSTLAIRLDGYTPRIGQQHNVLWADEIYRGFDSLDFPKLPDDRFLTTQTNKNMISLITAVPLREGDHDPTTNRRARYNGTIRDRETVAPNPTLVRTLKTRLTGLGFRIIGQVSGNFDTRTRWGVREFQIYTKMDTVAVEQLNRQRYLDRLVPQMNDKKRAEDARVTGVATDEIFSLVDYWVRNNWRCPVVVEARDWRSGTANPIRAENIWDKDEYQMRGVRMYVKDFTSYYTLPSSQNKESIIIGHREPRPGGRGGPVTVPINNEARNGPTEVWPEAELTPETWLQRSTNDLTDAQFSTYKVVRSVANVECNGFADSINSWDNSIVSIGPCHWTLGQPDKGKISEGELPAYFSYLQNVSPDQFRDALQFFGINVVDEWTDTDGNRSGRNLWNGGQRNYTSRLKLQEENGWENVTSFRNEAEYFRTWHWFYRFLMAARTMSEFKNRMWHFARVRIRDILQTPFGGGIPDIRDGDNKRPARIGDVYTSELAVALLLRWHVFRPKHVAGVRNPNNVLRAAFNRAKTPENSPRNWGNGEEANLIDGIVDEVDSRRNNNDFQDLHDTMTRIRNFRAWRAREDRSYPGFEPTLSSERNSFIFYDGDLPPAPYD